MGHWNHITVSNDSNRYGDMIPTGQTTKFNGFNGIDKIGGVSDSPTYWDDGFKAISSVTDCPTLTVRVKDGADSETSALWMDSEFRWVQVFTAWPIIRRGENAIAVEPMNSECNAWNNM